MRVIDKQNVLGSIKALPDQCLHAWEDASKINVPDDYKNVKAVVMCGMGGSGLGARVIESVYADEIQIPLVRINDYNLPKFVDKNTLVICSSYSGETEETLENAKQAINLGAKWMAIGAGNTLIKMAQKTKVPHYQINPQYNPSNQPRMAIGYSIVGQLVLAAKAGIINFQKQDLDSAVKAMRQIISETDQIQKLARAMKNKIICYVSARHLVGPMHVVNNQLNENAKNFSADFVLPEINHHLMEGLKYPAGNHRRLFVFFANSSLYPERMRKRLALTKEIMEKHRLKTYEYTASAKTEIAQAFELIQFGALVNFYLAMTYKQDPAPIPWVDYFKNKLGQPLGK